LPGHIGRSEELFHRPAILRAFPQLSDEIVSSFFEKLNELAQLKKDPPAIYHLERDPDDEPYINLAIEHRIPFIVSRDNDLLSLMTDEPFRSQFPFLTILTPRDFLTHVRTEVAKKLGYE
jgi:predicted nucleic acid-binding protein